MNTNHTPGPWWFSENLETDVFSIGQGDVCIASAHAPKLPQGVKFGFFDKGDARANARLIAAAPDLLRALLEYVERHEAEGSPEGLPEYEQARAAIAKATGAA